MRRIVVFALFAVLGLVMSALPAGATHYEAHEITITPGESVQLLDGIFINVDVNGTVSIIDGIFVRKYAPDGGQPLSISVGNDHTEFTIIPGGLCTKLCF